MMLRMKNVHLIFIIVILVVTCLFGNSSLAQEQRILRVGVWAGSYTDCMVKHIASFEEEYNCKVEFFPASGDSNLQRARTGQVDVAFNDAKGAFVGEGQGLWAKLDEKEIPNMSRLIDGAILSDRSISVNIGSYIIAYNPDYVKLAPTSWEDLWKPEYKNRVSIYNFSLGSIQLLVWAAKQAGGNEYNIDPGFKKMSELSENIRFFHDNHPQLLTAFKNGDVWIALWNNGTVEWAKQEGANVEWVVPKEGAFTLSTQINITEKSPNLDLAKVFVNWRLSDPVQLEFAKELLYNPVIKGVEIPKEVQHKLATEEELERQQEVDWGYVTPLFDEWYERWKKEI